MSEAAGATRPGRWRRVARILGFAALALVLVVAGGALWLRSRVLGSLAELDGDLDIAGLAAPVVIERDALGVPTLQAGNRLDLARATGFVHAQDRLFQMDLLRRRAAGRLSELFGAAAIDSDRALRRHRFASLAEERLRLAAEPVRALLVAYTEGVNAGVEALDAPPPEYLLLRTTPEPWRPEDCLLVVFAMYADLQGDDGARESALGLVHELLPPALAAFLTPLGDEQDAPLLGAPFSKPVLPSPAEVDLRPRAPLAARMLDLPREDPETVLGSNNWAVAGAHARGGAALLANDMHLGLGMPNIWYRASLVWPGDAGPHRITGVMLPGSPWIISGSNGRIAWGFTNSQGDWSDLVLLEAGPGGNESYLTPDGPRTFEHFHESIGVRGGESRPLEVLWTVWGPVVDEDHHGRRRALRWVAHDSGPARPGFEDLEAAGDVDSALAIAIGADIPTQNFVVADAHGRIGWTLMGPLPQRFGHDGRKPSSWADGTRGWNGRCAPEDYPRLVDPASGRIWTANNRTVDGEWLARMGDGGYAHGARAAQIRDGLLALESASAEDLLRVQLDDRALFLEPWRGILLTVLSDDAVNGQPLRARMRDLVRHGWTGRASIDSVGYRLVRGFRIELARKVFGALTAPCRAVDPEFDFLIIGRWEAALRALVAERPAHLLPPELGSWDAALLAAVDAVLVSLTESGADLEQRTWGERNTVHVRHPISLGVPQLARWLDIAPEPLPGDASMPRVQSPGFGASERMVVSPGREHEGLFHMPGGQSGHPFSPYYRAGHRAWAEGRPAPFLPGAAEHRLVLR